MNRSLSLAVSTASLFLSACNPPPYPAWSETNDAELVSQVVVSDARLQDVVRIGRVLATRAQPENNLRIVVPVRNIDDEPIRILAQFSFLTAQKEPLLDDTNRQVRIIPSGGTVNLECFSRSAQAADWTLRLSWDK